MPDPDKHVLYVAPGHENDPQVLLILGDMRARYGPENVTVEIDRAAPDPASEPDDEPREGGDRRVVRLPPDADD